MPWDEDKSMETIEPNHSPEAFCPESERPGFVSEACTRSLAAVQDALYVIGGKWKLPIIIALFEGPVRFRELQRKLKGITPKVLSKELKELELNTFITRTVWATSPVTVEYKLTPYSKSLEKVLFALREWGEQHKAKLKACSKIKREKEKEKLAAR